MSIKNRFRTFLAVSICLLAVASVATAQYSGGTGEPNDPYQIATAADLIALGETPDDYDKHFILTANIDLDPNLPGRKVFDRAVIAPDRNDAEASFQGTAFSGVFDGNGYIISHLTIRGVACLGLFGQLATGAMISNLDVEAADVNGTGSCVGALVGSNHGSIVASHSSATVTGAKLVGGFVGFNGGSIATSYSSGAVSGGDDLYGYVGGLVGGNDGGSITTSYSTCAVAGDGHVGGLVGYNSSGTITASYSTGMVGGDIYIGGLVGFNYGGGNITASYSGGMVSGRKWVGGLVGYNWVGDDSRGVIVAGYSTSEVGGNEGVGGLAGGNRGYITKCYSTGVISGNVNVGGLAGECNTWGIITNCYSIASVSGLTNVTGGLVGLNHGYLRDCYARNEVTGNERVGGLVGMNHREVTRCYCVGSVAGDLAVGGLVGSNVFSDISEIVGCFWDAQTSGSSTMCGLGIGDDAGGKTTAEMQSSRTLLDAGWDFVGETNNGLNDVWKIVEGQTYPLLSWQKYGGGTGEPNDPYLIYTAEHLNALGADPNDYDKHFKLMADISLSGYTYDRAVIAPITPDANDRYVWRQGPRFSGSFDGNSRIISHLTINGDSYLGLFGVLDVRAEICDVSLEAVDVNGIGHSIGGLAGISIADITSSCSNGVVQGDSNVGGLVGTNYKNINYCYSTGTVMGNEDVGGLAGRNGRFRNFYASIATSFSSSEVEGKTYVGGLVGTNSSVFGGVSITTSFSTGGVVGSEFVGGLVGDNSSFIANCYSNSAATGDEWVGGLVGNNSDGYFGGIGRSYSTGTVIGSVNVGGLLGYDSDGRMTRCRWDIETSGQTTSAGGIGKTSAEMKTATTFLDAGWDFIDETVNGTDDIWWILEGQDYPRLWWEGEDEEPGQ